MEINFDGAVCTNRNYMIEGRLDQDRIFTAMVNWNNFDGWTVTADDIIIEGDWEATQQELESIVEHIISHYDE